MFRAARLTGGLLWVFSSKFCMQLFVPENVLHNVENVIRVYSSPID